MGGATPQTFRVSEEMLNRRYRNLSTGLIREGELEGHPILSAHYFRDVTFASRVFDEVDGPRPDRDLLSSRNFDLSPAAQRDHILAAWGSMPVLDTTARRSMKLSSGNLRHPGDLSRAAWCELQFYLFGMRLIIWTRVESSHEYRLVCLSHNHARLGEVRAD